MPAGALCSRVLLFGNVHKQQYWGRFIVDDRELRRGGTSYTIDTLCELQDEYCPDAVNATVLADNWCVITGEDCLDTFHTWRDYKLILRRAFLAVARRGNSGAVFKKTHLSPREMARVRFTDKPISVVLISSPIRVPAIVE